jgi:glycosidase
MTNVRIFSRHSVIRHSSFPRGLCVPTPLVISGLSSRLDRLYGERGLVYEQRILALAQSAAEAIGGTRRPADAPPWDERDAVLIAYADQVRSPGEAPLATLRQFLLDERWNELLSTIHLLPFYPYSSDDGFAVIDYLAVDPQLGSWDDVARLGGQFDVMFDLVLNHVSRDSQWFQKYLAGESPYDRFFVEVDPTADLSAVVRPRSTPLVTPFDTSRGRRHLWTTFSADQIDLNYAEPEVLLRMIEVLLDYVRRGARIIRLDAVAFLWKQIGTPSIHLPQTHEIVKLLRDVLSAVAPHVLLLTETNVPHAENVSYFGRGDEAHLVYQFSLPPLLLDAFASGDAGALADWLAGLTDPPPGTTYLNFTASHDGVGIRPLQGLVPYEHVERLVAAIQRRGGLVSARRRPDGSEVPYEFNVTYVDALSPDEPNSELHARRFLATQAVMLALRGIPAVYFNSLVGAQNDCEAARQTGQPRRINRRKFSREELGRAVSTPGLLQQQIYSGYRALLTARTGQKALHPDAPQRVVPTGNPAVLALERISIDGNQRLLAAVNVSPQPQSLDVMRLTPDASVYRRDLISGQPIDPRQPLVLSPAQAVWLSG